jgi:hypothetical protein
MLDGMPSIRARSLQTGANSISLETPLERADPVT